MGKLWSRGGGGRGEHSFKIMSFWRWLWRRMRQVTQSGQDLCQSWWLTAELWSAATSLWLRSCFCFLPAQHCLGCGQCPWGGMGLLASRGLPFPSWGSLMSLKAAATLGKLHLPSSPQVLFALLHQNKSPSPEGWHQLMEEQCFQRLWLLLTTHFWSKTPLINWSLPMDTQVPSFPATKTKLRCAGVITVNAPSLPYRSCFQREESGLKAIAQHSIAIFDFPPLRHRWGKRKQHETSPFLGLPKTSLCWRKAPCQVPCKTAFCYEFFWAWRHITRHILSTW